MLSRLDPIIERLGKGYRPGPSAALSAALIVAMLLLLPWSPALGTSFDDGEAGAATNGPVPAVSTSSHTDARPNARPHGHGLSHPGPDSGSHDHDSTHADPAAASQRGG